MKKRTVKRTVKMPAILKAAGFVPIVESVGWLPGAKRDFALKQGGTVTVLIQQHQYAGVAKKMPGLIEDLVSDAYNAGQKAQRDKTVVAHRAEIEHKELMHREAILSEQRSRRVAELRQAELENKQREVAKLLGYDRDDY